MSELRAAHRRSGFTLIELLVVVSIVALLIAMLLPALTKARSVAQRALCAARLRQVSLAAAVYLDDHHDAFPITSSLNVQHAMAEHGGKAGTWGANYAAPKKLLNPYVGVTGSVTLTSTGAVEVFRCPSDTGARSGAHAGLLPTLWDRLGFSYWYNGDGNGSNLGIGNRNLRDIQSPAKVIYANDGSFNCYWQNWNPSRLYYWHHDTELGWGNVAFIDGHLNYLRATNIPPDWARRGDGWTFIYND